MVKVPYNIPKNINVITYMMIDLMKFDLERSFRYLCDIMNLSQYSLRLDLSIPYHPQAFGLFRSYDMTINIYIGSIIYCFVRSDFNIFCKRGTELLCNTIYNVMIHELSHAGQCMFHKTKRGIKEFSVSNIEYQNYKHCYDVWYPTLSHDLDKLIGVNPTDTPFYWDQPYKDISPYMGCSDLMQLVYVLGVLNNGSYIGIYKDLFGSDIVDLSVITTDLYNNILDINYIGLIKDGYNVPRGAFEKIIKVYEDGRIDKRLEENVYYSSVEGPLCRMRLFVRMGYYDPLDFYEKDDKKRSKNMIAEANSGKSETTLYDATEGMINYVDKYLTDNFGAFEVDIKKEGK